MDIESEMVTAYKSSGRKVFWAHQLGEAREVDQVWQRMASEGKIRFVASIYCMEGHEAWGGDPDLIPANGIKVCEECGIQDELLDETWTETRAVLTDDWCNVLIK